MNRCLPEFWDECGVNIDGVKNTLEWGLVFDFGFDVFDDEGNIERIGWDEKGAGASAAAAKRKAEEVTVSEEDLAKVDRLVSKLSSGEVGLGASLISFDPIA